MPPFETMDRPQKATYWEKTGTDRLGQFVVGIPVTLDVQWDDNSAEMLDPKGNTITVDATVFTDRPLVMGSIMRYGTLADWQGTGSVLVPSGLMEVKAVSITPDLKGRNKVYFYGLYRYGDVLPTVGYE